VSSPDIDDLGKLKRVMRYLRDTKDLSLTLEASGDGVIRWWVDASFAVHPNMRSQSGAVAKERLTVCRQTKNQH
jgi:hypothetical protein